MKYHLAQYQLMPKERKIRWLKDSKCGVRGGGLSISNRKCGTVVKGKDFAAALKRLPENCCLHCIAQFKTLKKEINRAQ